MTETGSSVNDGVSTIHSYYIQNTTLAPTQNLFLTGTFEEASAIAYCIANANSSSFQQRVTISGNQQTATTATLGPTVSVTPNFAGDLLFADVGVANNTIRGLTGTGQSFHSEFWSEETINTNGLDQNNGWGVMTSPNTSSQSFIWNLFDTADDAVGNWISESNEFH